jgi:RES domain-containing protein
VPDPTLVALIEQLTPVAYAGHAYRHLAPGYSAYSGEGARAAGGRWNPPNSFPVLYLALDEDTVTAEVIRHAARTGRRPEDLLPRLLYRYQLDLGA